ncbi:pyridoxal kinase [Sabethes cyaneus]|uniref:pyridoxal kinase n=1 Tax=Sabethes cyaneus TaxID=53552 RepID=UPI00237E9C99|nr:pyridoxal kinase [Sabethes cyaneus]XP_053685477.1 pyridoxal kinase [Sabethes cyaneus]XP_053685478.1 pyridoxal kinase [Sabethes cyaneus]XP_053685479.1 pyridoxal kinase [Sabethes cyaneus]XP_053685480.1 pyridoxal kinase [Sabethes cyaneus]XP_053685482.1 pyridoxal kinase [Sabethes cyaneus]
MTSVMNRVLSIQSHVVHGYVGNKSAVFPLQVLGFEVDNINSVQFSNHTGYKQGFKGQILNETELGDVFSGLVANDLHSLYTHLLTGYVGNPTFLREIANILKKLRSVNPSLIYVCDPVMGDDGIMYVPKELLPIYRDEIIPLADIVTPNQFEVELLTGVSVKTEQDAWTAVEWFHSKGIKTVAISSSELGGSNSLLALVSHKNGNNSQRYRMVIPKQGNGIRFTGTGDLFASLFLAHSTLTGFDMGATLERTIATLQAVISKTLLYLPDEVKSGKTNVTSAQRELKLIQSKKEIEEPNVTLHCTKV